VGNSLLQRPLFTRKGGTIMATPEKINMEYLISKYLLKQLLNKGLITEAEFQRIDNENRKSFAH
jgi:hypothetical protein